MGQFRRQDAQVCTWFTEEVQHKRLAIKQEFAVNDIDRDLSFRNTSHAGGQHLLDESFLPLVTLQADLLEGFHRVQSANQFACRFDDSAIVVTRGFVAERREDFAHFDTARRFDQDSFAMSAFERFV